MSAHRTVLALQASTTHPSRVAGSTYPVAVRRMKPATSGRYRLVVGFVAAAAAAAVSYRVRQCTVWADSRSGDLAGRGAGGEGESINENFLGFVDSCRRRLCRGTKRRFHRL
jgi:hypothetical protein